MDLKLYLQKEIGLAPEDIYQLDKLFEYQEYPKDFMLLNKGHKSKKVYFIEEGLIRVFYTKDEKEITDDFYKENTFFLSLENIFFNTKDEYNYELLENCKIRMTEYSKLETLLETHPKFNTFVRKVMAYHIQWLNDRLYALQFQSAQEKYEELMKKHPDLILRAPLGYIASYLGITQQTLSVIRAGVKFNK